MRFKGALLIGAMLALGACGPRADADGAKAVFQVEGMSCEGCQNNIQSALEKVAGVRTAAVSHKEGRASVVYDPAKVSPADLEKVIEERGYPATLEKAGAKG
jgi:copper chaperone CopZ